MGYLPVLELPTKVRECQVVAITKNYIEIKNDDEIQSIDFRDIEFWNIKRWSYAGELAGNEHIPEGHAFRDRLCGELMTFNRQLKDGVVELANDRGAFYNYDKSEIEPIFE